MWVGINPHDPFKGYAPLVVGWGGVGDWGIGVLGDWGIGGLGDWGIGGLGKVSLYFF